MFWEKSQRTINAVDQVDGLDKYPVRSRFNILQFKLSRRKRVSATAGQPNLRQDAMLNLADSVTFVTKLAPARSDGAHHRGQRNRHVKHQRDQP